MKTFINRKYGVSMLEVMIGVFIFAIAFIPLFSLVQYGGKATVKVNNYSKVATLAQRLIEECRFVPFKVYIKDYKEMGNNESFSINPNYYPKTSVAIADFQTELKSLEVKADLTVKKLTDGRISEVWINISANWQEGDGTTEIKPRELRLGNVIRNPDCYM